MRFSTHQALFGAALSALAITSVSQASLSVDLRAPDGTHNIVPSSAGDLTPITFNAWVIINGTAGNAAADGLQSTMFAVKSNVVAGGITGSISSAALATGWAGAGAGVGTASNISTDGIGDWGNASNNTIGSGISSFFRARTSKSTNNAVDWGDANSPLGSNYNTLVDGGVEFMVGTFTFTPTAMPINSVLQLVPVTPLGGTTNPYGWFEDTVDKTAVTPTGSRNSTNGTFGPATPNSGSVNSITISVGIPEPASLGFVGLAGIGLLRRSRKHV